MDRLSCAAVGLAVLLLPACTSTASTLSPANVAAAQPAPLPLPPGSAAVPPAPATTPPSTGQTAPLAAAGQQAAVAKPVRVEFAPIVGATVESVAPLSRRLAVDAKARGIALAPANDPGITHVMKGYFSAFSEGKQTTVVYVWDVIDPAGNRLHRIEGQKVTTDQKGGGWASVTPATMEAIADDTVNQLVTWMAVLKS